MKLAEQLGSFAGQLYETEISGVEIAYAGHVAELNVKPLTAIILTALLAPQMPSVNVINVPIICRERNIPVNETRSSEATDFHTLVRVGVTTRRGQRSVAGTLFGGDKPRIVSVEDIPLEAELGAHMLVVHNTDRPGFIGNLGRMMGEAGINIATLHLGRAVQGGEAICLVQIDATVSAELLERVRRIPNVNQAKHLQF
jgi:D-3-phosphoglycerate dehydrogenase